MVTSPNKQQHAQMRLASPVSGFRGRIVNWLIRGAGFEEKAEKAITQSPGGPLVYLENAYAQVQARSVRQVAQYGYLDNINVFRAVNILADECGAIGWDVFVGKGKNKVKQDESHPLVKLLQKPNPDQAASTYMQRLVAHWILAGTVYQFAAFAGMGNGNAPDIYPRKGTQPAGLYILHPMQVEPQIINGQLTTYRYQIGPQYIDYPIWKVLPLRFFHPLDELAGTSPIMVAALVIERQNEGEAWNFSLMKHAARPSGAFIAQNRLGEISYGELKTEVRRIWGAGKQNVGYPLVLDNGLSYTQLGLSPLDVDWNVSDSNAGRKIATAIGVDPLLLNDKEHSTYNNVREARLACIEMTVIPIMDRIKDEWNGWLCPFYGDDVSVDYDKSTIEILRGNRSLFSSMVIAEWNTGLRSFNESTAELKLNKVGETDDFYKFGPAVFIRRSNIGTWLDQQEERNKPAPVPPQIAGYIGDTQLPPGNNGNVVDGGKPASPNGNDPKPPNPHPNPLDLPKLTTKADDVFHTLLIGSVQQRQPASQHKMSQADRYYLDMVNKEHDAWADKMSEHVAQFFVEEIALIKAYAQSVTSQPAPDMTALQSAIMTAIETHTEALPHVLVPYYLDIAEAAKNRAMTVSGLSRGIAAQKSLSVSNISNVSIHKKDALSDLANYASSHIVGINETTRAKINDIFLEAQAKQWTVDEVLEGVTSQYENFSHSRALTIARTETIAASNLGGQIAMRQTGLPILKTWLATQDGLTRDWHEIASGQQVKLDEPYEVNGEALMFPGDTSMGASAPNTINCRCAETYSIDYDNLPEEAKDFFFKHVKFNPYHDAHGRFASGGGLGLNPAGQGALPGMDDIALLNPGAFVQPALMARLNAGGVYTDLVAMPGGTGDAEFQFDIAGIQKNMKSGDYQELGDPSEGDNPRFTTDVNGQKYFVKRLEGRVVGGDPEEFVTKELAARNAALELGLGNVTVPVSTFSMKMKDDAMYDEYGNDISHRGPQMYKFLTQPFIKSSGNGFEFEENGGDLDKLVGAIPKEHLTKLVSYEYLMGTADRHWGQYLIRENEPPTKSIVLNDFDYGFPTHSGRDYMPDLWSSASVNNFTLDRKTLETMYTKKERVMSSIEQYFPHDSSEYQALAARFDMLKDFAGSIGDGQHSIDDFDEYIRANSNHY